MTEQYIRKQEMPVSEVVMSMPKADPNAAAGDPPARIGQRRHGPAPRKATGAKVDAPESNAEDDAPPDSDPD